MATYIIGDIQGCYASFRRLLKKIDFDPKRDHIWCTGDLINRGENSLATLRFIYQHRESFSTVLGNHDLHLLNLYFLKKPLKRQDTCIDILLAADADSLIAWLRERPMSHYFSEFNLFLCHAGLYPLWSVQTALALGQEIQQALNSEQTISTFFKQLYGDEPKKWHDQLTGANRARFIVNAMTRMRFLTAELELDLKHQSTIADTPAYLHPWFNHPHPLNVGADIAFGHWAALQGDVQSHTNGTFNVFGLDTGCVWGHLLTALRLEDRTLFQTR